MSSNAEKPVEKTGNQKRRVLQGIVVSDKMEKTIVVKVNRRIKHPKFRKYVVRSQKVKVHDEKNQAHEGDVIAMIESRPLSKHKRWVLTEVVRRSGQEDLVKA